MVNRPEAVQSIPIASAVPKVLLVSNYQGMQHLLAMAQHTVRCDVVFVESTAHAYSQVKRLAPDLVVVCLEIDDLDGCQVLSMLMLDSRTREIPVMTCTMWREAIQSADDSREREELVFLQRPAVPVN
jgi:CheY-like chemotaxis protein